MLIRLLKKTIILIITFFSYNHSLYSQKNSPQVFGEAAAYLSSSKETSFWQRANQYGSIPLESNFIQLKLHLHKEYDSTGYQGNSNQKKNKKFGYGYDGEIISNLGIKQQILIPEAYIKLRFMAFELWGGRRKEMLGLVDTLISMGSVNWSGSALPMPKIQIGIPNYVSILGKGIVSIKGAYSHGWFGQQGYTQDYFLHQKWLYGKIGRDSWKINLFGGFNHSAQWGGHSDLLKNNTASAVDGQLPQDFFVYKNIVLPFSFWKFPENHNYTPYETLNRFGNHLGNIDLGARIKTKKVIINIFRQTPYEDGQAPEVFLSADGNYSLGFHFIDKKILSRLSFGYLDTRRQGGKITKFASWLGKNETHPGEIQGYFNQGQYINGWSYNEFPIGTPFIMNLKHTKGVDKKTYLFTLNNSVQALYFAASGQINRLNYLFQNSYSFNYGLYGNDKMDVRQYSAKLDLKFPLKYKNTLFKTSISMDKGGLITDGFGMNVTFMKKFY
jgi:hypothetical protein